MKNPLGAIAIFGFLAVAHGSARANGVPGSSFHPQFPTTNNVGCLAVESYSALANQCGALISVISYLPTYNGNAISLTGFFGANTGTMCQASVINNHGDSVWNGGIVSAHHNSNGTMSFQTLPLGSPPVIAGDALSIGCQLEINPSGVAGASNEPFIGEVAQ